MTVVRPKRTDQNNDAYCTRLNTLYYSIQSSFALSHP